MCRSRYGDNLTGRVSQSHLQMAHAVKPTNDVLQIGEARLWRIGDNIGATLKCSRHFGLHGLFGPQDSQGATQKQSQREADPDRQKKAELEAHGLPFSKAPS